MGLACPTCANRRGLLWTPSTKKFHLSGSRRRAFSAVAPVSWNLLAPDLRSPPLWLSGGPKNLSLSIYLGPKVADWETNVWSVLLILYNLSIIKWNMCACVCGGGVGTLASQTCWSNLSFEQSTQYFRVSTKLWLKRAYFRFIDFSRPSSME